MARTPKGYWEKRSTDLMLRLEKRTEKTIDNLVKVYNQATMNINKEINEIFRNYASESGLSREVLTKMLNKRETDTYYRNLLNTIEKIKNEDVRKKLLAKYNAPAYSYRINRFQALQNNIDVEIAKIVDIEQTITKERYVDTIKEGYYHNIYDIQKGLGYGFNFSKIDTKTINLMLNEKWAENGNFSSRIWKNADRLSDYLKINFTADTMSGKSISAMSKELSDTLNIGLYKSTRLIRTEVNHFANESEMLSYEELGIEKYRFVATLDNVTCKHCAQLDNKVFNVKDRQAGKNYPPIHPNDRCTTVAVFDSNGTEDLKRRAIDEYGNTIFIPQDMNYDEWTREYIPKLTLEQGNNNDKREMMNYQEVNELLKSTAIKPILHRNKITSYRINKYQNKIMDLFYKNGNENMCILNVNTGELIGNITEGKNRTTVGLNTPTMLKLLTHRKNSIIAIHNHPENYSFSLTDIQTFNKIKQIDTMVVLTEDYKYYLRAGTTKKYTKEYIQQLYEKIEKKTNKMYNNLNNVEKRDLTNQKFFQKVGWIYEKEKN